MDNQEIEQFVIQKGCYEVANYFRDLFMNKRIEGKVAVVVEDYTTSFFFMPCDKYGYPKINEQRYLSFLDNNVNWFNQGSDPTIEMCKVTEKDKESYLDRFSGEKLDIIKKRSSQYQRNKNDKKKQSPSTT